MQIKGTITRAYVGEGLTGTNSRFNGRNVIHVLPEDSAVLKDLDGDHQTAAGEVRIVAPEGELPEVGSEFDFELDENKPALEVKGSSGGGPRRRARGGEGGGEST